MVMQAYPVSGKRKSFDLCQAFIEGAKRIGAKEHASVFYGIGPTNFSTWLSVRKKSEMGGPPFYFIDNSYFDASRSTHFRVTKNALQYQGRDESTGERLRAIFGGNPEIKPWRDLEDGYILVVPQSDVHMQLTVGYQGNWLNDTMQMCAATWPNNGVKLRPWSPDKVSIAKSLPEDLVGARRLVTHTSAAAITAAMDGVISITDKLHALAKWRFAGAPAEDQRLHCLSVLADNQWTLDEIKQGKAWAWLNRTDTGSR